METTTVSQKPMRGRSLTLSLALMAILLLGSAFRFYNVNWDEGTYHIHPDERHTTMVITRIEWPGSLAEYLDTSHSLLNARNVDMVYFYGTLPLFLTKAVGTLLGRTGYDEIHLVGRVLSGIFDLASVLLLFFLARRLFNWRVGLVSALLLALAALNIQGSHYFAVDTFLTFFVQLTIWFTLDVAEGKRWPAFLALGIAMGLTLACKVSVFLLAVVVVVGAWVRLRRKLMAGRQGRSAALGAVVGLALAALVAIAVFRVAQPYAWAGPNYSGWDAIPEPWGERLQVFKRVPEPIRAVLMPNPQWIADIVSAGAQQTGEADLPWGRQWTERTPWLYPLENMVLWGMGLPLGVAAWLGVVGAIVAMVRHWWRRRSAGLAAEPAADQVPQRWDVLLIPLSWVLLTFGWQGMQFVKSIRYFLPIYPYLAMFAAYLVVMVWDWARAQRPLIKAAGRVMAGLVPVGTLLWALAFIQIYTEPVTRVQATRWIYENIESAATLHYRTSDGEPGWLQVPTPASHLYAYNGEWLTTPFSPPTDLIATEVVMNNLVGLDQAREGQFELQLTSDSTEDPLLSQAQIEATFGGSGGKRHLLDIPDTELRQGQTYYLQTRVLQGAPLVSQGSAIANEHFDDPLPFNMDGRIGFGTGPYRSLDLSYENSSHQVDQLPLYDEDTPRKLEMLLDGLDQADYIIMSSGRLWQSIPRLPMRYPVTTRYYDLLFAEELGFEKAAEFHSYPRLLGIEFDDTWAEEQFTVYDHPKVLIYRKTDAYDREQVEALLTAGVDWGSIPHWLNPRDVPEWRREQKRAEQEQAEGQSIAEAKNSLMLSGEQRELQESSGTWASIFRRNSLANRWPTISWLVLMTVLGLSVLPLVMGLFRWLPDQGYVLARPVAVLLLAWLSWILTNLTPLHYSRGTIALSLGLISLLSWGSLVLPGQRRRLSDFWRDKKRLILIGEGLFLLFFFLFWFIRWGNPDLWHAWKGGEKPMDLAYLNAVIKSIEFPPYDPWFAGGYLNYYYFGQVMVGTLVKLVGIVPNIAYNLAIPTWFAMTAMGAFCVVYNLVAGKTQGTSDATVGSTRPDMFARPVVFGLVGALFVAVVGNLAQIYLVLLKAGEGVMEGFQSTIPGLAGLVRTAVGSVEVLVGGRVLPIGIGEWYWNASRAIPGGPSEAVITEFPFFTFLYADLHAHLISMPLTLVSLAAALTVVKRFELAPMGQRGWRFVWERIGLLLLWSLAIGAMRTTNTWDVPPHLLLVLGATGIAALSRAEPGQLRFTWRRVWMVVWQCGLVFSLSWLVLYWPFWDSYGSFYDSIRIWNGTRTALGAYLVVHGLFLFAILSYLLARVFNRRDGWRSDPVLRRLQLTILYRKKRTRLREVSRIVGVRHLPLGTLAWLAIAVLILVEVLLAVPGLTAFTRANALAAEEGAYAYRGLAVLAFGVPIAIAGLMFLFRRGLEPTQRLWAYLVLLALAMSLGVEVIVLEGDIGRMNTVFKFYLQVWFMWGVAAAAALAWMIPRLQRWRQGRGLWLATLIALSLFAALYPPLATSAKIRDRFDADSGPGLDGWAYMETATYWDPAGVQYDLKWDLEAIRWLLDNVVGSPVILEGHAPEYRWGARYSINTGLPAVLGWNWHQRQQRAAANDQEVWTRANEVAYAYNQEEPALIQPILERYDVRYVIVGPLERAYYDDTGLAKFERMADAGMLQVAFRNQEVTIYEVPAK